MSWIHHTRAARRSGFLLGLLALLLASCRDATAPATDGELSALVGASGFSALTVYATFDDRAFTMSAVDEASDGLRSITLTILDVTKVGQYDLARSGNAGSYTEAKSDVTQSWLCATSQGTGSVVITELSSTRIVGTFSFSAPALITSGAMGTKVISSGSFDVRPWRE
jgi:hypothetical protein